MLAANNAPLPFPRTLMKSNRSVQPAVSRARNLSPGDFALLQPDAYRLVLDTVKLLDRGEVNDEPPRLTDEEWERLLGEEPSEEDA